MVYVALALLGLCLGSFVNAVVWRLYEQEKPANKRSKTSQKQLSITQGRSICPNCKRALAWYDLIPVVSWLWLKGACRYCHKPISWHYPAVELITATTFIISYAFWPLAIHGLEVFNFACWLLLITGLMALLVYDIKWMLLPNRIVYPLLALVIIQQIVHVLSLHGHTAQDGLLSAVWGLVIGGGIFYVLFQASRGQWIGGGDVKLGAVLGLVVGGPAASLLLLFSASLLGSAYTVPLLITKKAKTSSRVPFGPFLIIAGVMVKLIGASILMWYKRTFLIG